MNENVAKFGFYNRVEENLCLATTMEEIIDLLVIICLISYNLILLQDPCLFS